MPQDPGRIAATALANVSAHLRMHTSTRLLAAIARGSVLGTDPLHAYLRLNLGEHHDVQSRSVISD